MQRTRQLFNFQRISNERAIIERAKVLFPFFPLFPSFLFSLFPFFDKPMNNQRGWGGGGRSIALELRRDAEKWDKARTHAREELLFLPVETTVSRYSSHWIDVEPRDNSRSRRVLEIGTRQKFFPLFSRRVRGRYD